MPAGTLQYIAECQPVASGPAVAPCGTVGGTAYAPQMVQAYVIDPVSQGAIDGITEPFDYTYAAGVWAFFFVSIVSIYWVTRSANSVIEAVRRF